MLCELIGGFNPFTGGTIQETFENITKINVNWPKNISKIQRKLLETIFVHDPNMRAKVHQIKEDQYFKDIEDWDNLFQFLTNDQ